MELAEAWARLQGEGRKACEVLGREFEGPLSVPVAGIGEGSTTGATRKILSRAREELRLALFERSLKLERDRTLRGLSSWKERDKLSTAFLLSGPGPHYGLTSPVFAEAVAVQLCLPSRVCIDRIGEKVGASRVDQYGERVILENPPGGHWTTRHNSMEQELASLCAWSGMPAECELYGLFGHLIPQEALHRLQQNQRTQVLRPDLRLEVPPTTVKVGPVRHLPAPQPGEEAAAPPAPVSKLYSGSYIAEVKVVGLGAKSHYKPGTKAQRAVEKRAKEIPPDYKKKAQDMDRAMGILGEGPCQRRLAELPILSLAFGAYNEASPDVHTLVALLAASRVQTMALQGRQPSPYQLGVEVGTVRKRLSIAAARANATLLLARMGQVGEGSGLAGNRRAWQRQEERRMQLQREADWLVDVTGQEVVRRGRFWS